MKYVAIFHANLNYAYLVPDRYEFVIRASYELMIDTMRERFPRRSTSSRRPATRSSRSPTRRPTCWRSCKPAIGVGPVRIHGLALRPPDAAELPRGGRPVVDRVLERGLPATPRLRPNSFWNPECGWRATCPGRSLEAGYTNLIGDFEAYSRSLGRRRHAAAAGDLREGAHRRARRSTTSASSTICRATERAHPLPFQAHRRVPRGTGCGSSCAPTASPSSACGTSWAWRATRSRSTWRLIRKYSQQPPGEPEGALIIFADDAEYVGTNGWFRLKYQNQPDHVFERDARRAARSSIALISALRGTGQLHDLRRGLQRPAAAGRAIDVRRRLGLARRAGLDLGRDADGPAAAAVAGPGAGEAARAGRAARRRHGDGGPGIT